MGSTGGSDRSGSGAASGVVARLFINRVSEEIRSNWGIPPNIPMDGTLKAVVVFRIDEAGKVSNVQVEDTSGNSAFDEFCVQAIYKAAPLTPPPPELLEEAKTEGIEVSFTNDSN
jgi:TonB family C-terminal domain